MRLLIRERKENRSKSIDASLDVVVLFTTVDLAAAALKRAEELVLGIKSDIRLICTQIVPYPLPVERPPVNLRHLGNQLSRASQCAGLKLEGEIILARDLKTALKTALKPHSIVVLASRRRRLWRTQEEKLKIECEKAGHEVLLSYTR
jgi:hypothetical protein